MVDIARRDSKSRCRSLVVSRSLCRWTRESKVFKFTYSLGDHSSSSAVCIVLVLCVRYYYSIGIFRENICVDSSKRRTVCLLHWQRMGSLYFIINRSYIARLPLRLPTHPDLRNKYFLYEVPGAIPRRQKLYARDVSYHHTEGTNDKLTSSRPIAGKDTKMQMYV